MDILDMSLRQIIQAAEMHPVKDIGMALITDNVLASACAAAGWTKGETFFLKLSKFSTTILRALGKKVAPVSKPSGQSVLNYILLLACVFVVGCVAIHRQCDITIDNAQYTGVYCPGGCKATVHYQANTDIGVLNDNSRSKNDTNK